MRLLVEILIVAGLIYLGWEQPLKARLEQLEAGARAATAAIGSKLRPAVPQETAAPIAPTPSPTAIPQPRVILATPAPTPRDTWMWDQKYHSLLDRPVHGVDQFGRTYWIDANGVRHYDQ